MANLAMGAPAPDFGLATDNGGVFRLSEQRGRPVVLMFYPEDNTAGCIVENREFSALSNEFATLGAVVVGISPQDVKSHANFRRRNGLVHLLAADIDAAVIKAYGLWGPKKMFGREYMGVIRTSILVDTEGKIAGIYRASRIKGHAQAMLDAVRGLAAAR